MPKPRRPHSFRPNLRPLEDRITPSHDLFHYEDEYYFDEFEEFEDPVITDPFFDDTVWDFDPFEEFGAIEDWDDTEYFQLDPSEWFPLGADAGGAPDAVIVAADGGEVVRVTAYDPAFLGGVRVASGDVTGDGVPDLITVPGPGMPAQVKVFDGATGEVVRDFLAFEEAFTGGAFVVAADLTGDGISELVLSPDEGGGPRVRVLDGTTLAPLQDFFGIDDPNFRGGCRVAVGDVDADYSSDLVVSAGFGGGPRIAVFDGDDLFAAAPDRLLPDFFAFEDTLRNGAYPAVGDLNDDGFGDLVFGGGPGGAPRVLALDGYTARENVFVPIGNFFAGDPNDRTGVQVGVGGSATGNQILATPRGGETAGRFTPTGQPVATYDPFRQSAGGTTLGSTAASTRTTTATTTATTATTGRRPSDDAAFHHGAIVSNLKGNYTSEYFTTIIDEKAAAGSREKRVRVEAVLTIESVTPVDPNSDPARNDGGNYRWTGTMVVRPAGYLSMTVRVYGNYTCSQFPTSLKPQLGSTNLYTQGSAGYRTRPEVGATGSDTTTRDRISTNVFDFDKPGSYKSQGPHAIVLTKRN